MAYQPFWEYTQGSADAYEISHLCNHMAQYGWEPTEIFPYPRDKIELPQTIGDTHGPRRCQPYIQPYEVLFRRPADWTRWEPEN